MSHDGIIESQVAHAEHPEAVEEEPTIVVETTQGDEAENPALPEPSAKTSAAPVATLFRNTDAHPLALDLVLVTKYGQDWLRWEYESLVQHITQDFETPTVSDVNMEKIQACKALHLVDDFWLKWEVFNPCVAALNGSYADFDKLQVHTVAECALAVDIANRIRMDVPWSSEVMAFLVEVHRHDGILVPTPPLDFIAIDTSSYFGDYASVTKRWPVVRSANQAPGGDSIEDEQLRRMLASYRYLDAARKRLQSQLPVLQNV